MSLPLTAFAQDPNCPPGAWFCAEAEVQTPPPNAKPAEPPQAVPTPPAAAAPAQDDLPEELQETPGAPPADALPPTQRTAPPPPTARTRPPVVIYQPVPAPPPRVIVVSPGYPVREPPPPPPVPRAMHFRPEFGLNMRVSGLILGHDSHASENAGMGGIGLSLRYRPIPAFAFDAGIDLMAGNDYNGFERTEMPITLSGLLYLNPRSRVQFYLIGGMHYARAEVRSDSYSYAGSQLLAPDGGGYSAVYSYFGGQGGGGLEFRLGRRVALNIDGLAFIRKRVDDFPRPEYVDWSNGRATNTSAGGLLRGGITFWW